MSSMKTEIALGMQGGIEGTWEPIDTAPKDGSWVTVRYAFTLPVGPFKVRWRDDFWRDSSGLARAPDEWLKPKAAEPKSDQVEGTEGTWEPIDTAPKDGSWIPVRVAFGFDFYARWVDGRGWVDGVNHKRRPTKWLKPKATEPKSDRVEGTEGTWEPIATAPKDGTWVTAISATFIEHRVRWSFTKLGWADEEGFRIYYLVSWLKPLKTPDQLNDTPQAVKHDQGKPRLSLLLTHLSPSLEAMTKVLEYAREKYPSIDNYQGHGSQIPERYLSAALRHLAARASGELKDPESGCDHLAHAMVSLGFVVWWDSREGHEGV